MAPCSGYCLLPPLCLLPHFLGKETKHDPVGILGTEEFLCPPCFFVGNRLQPPGTYLSSKEQNLTGKGGGRRHEGGAA